MKKLMAIAAVLSLSACEMIALTALDLIVEVETTEFRVEGDALLMSGEINGKTLEQFERIYKENPQIRTLVELDVPGSVDDDAMILLAYRIRELGLNTHLRASSEVYSGGVDLFLAGVRRTIENGAIVGVHSWSDGFRDAAEYPKESPEHDKYRKYTEDMLGSDAFYWFTIYAAEGDEIHIMTKEEIRRYALATQ